MKIDSQLLLELLTIKDTESNRAYNYVLGVAGEIGHPEQLVQVELFSEEEVRTIRAKGRQFELYSTNATFCPHCAFGIIIFKTHTSQEHWGRCAACEAMAVVVDEKLKSRTNDGPWCTFREVRRIHGSAGIGQFGEGLTFGEIKRYMRESQ